MEKFDGKKNFSLWQSRNINLLTQQGLEDASNIKPDKGEDIAKLTKLNSEAVTMMQLCLKDGVVYNVLEETTAQLLC